MIGRRAGVGGCMAAENEREEQVKNKKKISKYK